MASTQLIVFCRIGDTSDHRDPDDLHQTVFAVMLTTRLFWLLAFAYCLQTAISLAVPRDLLTDPSFDSADLNITSLVQQLILQHTPRTGNDTQSKSSPRIVKRGPGLVFPTFMPTNDPDFPRIMSAYTEAIVLAAVTFKEMSQCDAVWQRYFLDEDWDWVRMVFGLISGAFENNWPSGPELFPFKVTIWADEGSHPACNDPNLYAWAGNRPAGAKSVNKYADIIVCPNNVRDKKMIGAIDCSELGDYDSDAMEPLSATILHEMMHIVAMISRLPGSDQLLDTTSETVRGAIGDYQRPTGEQSLPVNGYGFQQCEYLRDKGPRYARSNADSYVVFALSRYWSKRCGKVFGPE